MRHRTPALSPNFVGGEGENVAVSNRAAALIIHVPRLTRAEELMPNKRVKFCVKSGFVCSFSLLFLASVAAPAPAADDAFAWPAITSQTRPWTYWWWMGSAVDKTNLTRELQRYHDAGLGGVHIVPIYGAKGWESNYIGYLSPKWMEMLGYTVSEARRLGLGVDMTTGTGWCFGGRRFPIKMRMRMSS